MKKFNLLIGLVFGVLSFLSCGRKEANQIYMCGETSEHHAFYYSNGTQKLLCLENHPSAAYEIAVKDNAVYCIGFMTSKDTGKSIATLWKDGNAISITDGTNNAVLTDFAVTDDGIYCIGIEADGESYENEDNEYVNRNRAKIWFVKNDCVVKSVALTKGRKDASANSIYVDNDNVLHVVGHDHGMERRHAAAAADSRYWMVNGDTGVLIKTEALFINENSSGTAIWGADGTIMAAGYIDDDPSTVGGGEAIYWKDGFGMDLSSDYETIIEDGCMVGDDWYMCGHSRNSSNALYFKNGKMDFLKEGMEGVRSEAFSITPVNNDIYISGISSNVNGYWRNGKFKAVSELFGAPYGIFVIPAHVEPLEKAPKPKNNRSVIEICGRNELRALPDKSGYNLYSLRLNSDNERTFEKVNDVVFNGEYERLNIRDIYGSENMVILSSDQGKYLWNISEDCFMLDGNSFKKMERDNAGGLGIRTDAGLYHISDVSGLPGKVEKYYRSGTYHDMFLYKVNGKWGVYCKLMKSDPNSYHTRFFEKYMEILPPEYDKIRYVFGDGANHFVCQRNGRWEIRDAYGRRREMEYPHRIIMGLSTSRIVEKDRIYTSEYIGYVLAIKPDMFEDYNTFFKTNYTSFGDDEACVILLENHELSYQSRFYYGDRSRDHLSWDDDDKVWEYGYTGSGY